MNVASHRNRFWFACMLGLMGVLGGGWLSEADDSDARRAQVAAERLFAVEVLPLFKAKCFACHGDDPDDLKSGFDMRNRAGLLEGGDSGEPAVVPGKPEDSPLYEAVRWEGLEMPPKENDRLTAAQIEKIRQWIAAGAPWPDEKAIARYRKQAWSADSADGIRVATSGGLTEEWTNRTYDPDEIWAFLPVRKPAVPEGAAHPIDAFIEARLAEAGLDPAPQADPHTLLRRATYDLLGLPPTPEETDAFLAAWQKDPEQAWSDLIDRLLASPHYGERWAQHWLDVVRYADTSGFSNDWERSNAWRYRDYVIRAFNEDKPYDKFIIEQIAGDELDPGNPEMLVAVGFLRMGPWEHTPMSPGKVSRQQYLDDVVNSIGQTFLSTALRCTKCHDHKFDPIPTRDYYRLYAALATTQPAERPAAFLPQENLRGFEENRRHVERLLEFAKTERDKLYAKREAAARRWYAERGRESEYVPYEQRLRIPGDDKPPRFVGLTTAEEGILKVREQDVRIWTRRLERFEPLAQSVYNGGDLYQRSQRLRMPEKPWEKQKSKVMPETHIYAGGNIFSPTERVTPGVLSALGLPSPTGTKDDPYALPQTMSGRRLALARWIAHPDNPLTTRSIVNRVWHYHFGRGLADNPNNFGTTGANPSHPELLDWLAAWFVEQGWSIKKLHRLIMTSAAYRRASEHPQIDLIREQDPNNKLLAVFEPRRLTAEELRDSMLAVSGELNPEIGGLPVRPEINLEVALAPRMLQFSLAPAWQPSRTPAERNRRSIYVYRVRGLANPFMEVFNQPRADDSCEARESSTITPQVFALWNSGTATKRAIAFALRLEREADTPAARIDLGHRLAFGKPASPTMLQTLLNHYREMVQYHRRQQPEPTTYPTRVTRSLVEEFSGEAFEYEELLDIYEDYVPDPDPADVSPETRALADICLLLFNSNRFIYVY